MRTLLLSSVLLLGLASAGPAAPALPDKPQKWEYAELTYRTVPGRARAIDADGNVVAAVPPAVTIHWISGAGEVDVKGWDELADKLEAPAFKKGSFAYQKIQVLNYLGGEGWELMEQQSLSGAQASVAGFGGRDRRADGGFGGSSPTSTWLLKRRVP